MKGLIIILFVSSLSLLAVAQEPARIDSDNELNGKIKSVAYERTYLVHKRLHVNPLIQRIAFERYDKSGFLIQSSIFGNGEQRALFEHAGNSTVAHLKYFDEFGNALSEKSVPFNPNTNVVSDVDLCHEYRTVKQNDPRGRIHRTTEICSDESIRAQETWELDDKNRDTRYFREDFKSRTWEQTSLYDLSGNLIELTYTVDDKKKPKYTQFVQYVLYKFDSQKNWVEVIASSFDSRLPGELIYQFIEKRNIAYYVNDSLVKGDRP